jgi:hypothetical protein
VDITRLAFAQREYRSVTTEDLAVRTRHPLATELSYNTFLANSTDATTFGNSILSLLKLDRYNWSIRVRSTAYPQLAVGDSITVVYPRYGLAAGKKFIVKRIRLDTTSQWTEMTLFGPE